MVFTKGTTAPWGAQLLAHHHTAFCMNAPAPWENKERTSIMSPRVASHGAWHGPPSTEERASSACTEHRDPELPVGSEEDQSTHLGTTSAEPRWLRPDCPPTLQGCYLHLERMAQIKVNYGSSIYFCIFWLRIWYRSWFSKAIFPFTKGTLNWHTSKADIPLKWVSWTQRF